MKRILKFAKIDIFRVKRYMWMILFPLIAVFWGVSEPESGPVFSMMYCLFAGIILSSMPISAQGEHEKGLLGMLPARPGEAVYGHYLFGGVVLFIGMLLGFVSIVIASLIQPKIILAEFLGKDFISIFILLFGGALVMNGLQLLILLLFRTSSMQVMQLIRLAPGFLFFFGSSFLWDGNAPQLLMTLLRSGGVILLICVLLYILLAWIAAKLVVRRG